MDLVFVVLSIGVIGVVAALLGGRIEARLSPATATRPMIKLPADDVTTTDIDALRFSLGLRGYRMDEVDAVLERLSSHIADLRARIADQDRQIATLRAGTSRRGMVVLDGKAGATVAEELLREHPAGGSSPAGRGPNEQTDR